MTEHQFKTLLLVGLAVSFNVVGWLWYRSESFRDWAFWMIWAAMVLHQCEENVFTEWAFGKQLSFFEWAHRIGYQLSLWFAVRANIGIGWTLAITSGIIGDQFCYIPLFVAAVEATNGFWHLSIFAYQQRWSPGSLSSLLVTIPITFALFRYCLDNNLVSHVGALIIFILAWGSHHQFFRSLPKCQ